MRIGIISDTHNFLPEEAINHLIVCDEIWHAGDIGSIDILEKLEKIKRTRAVYGNIDNNIIKQDLKEFLFFKVEGINAVSISSILHYNNFTADVLKQKLKKKGYIFRYL